MSPAPSAKYLMGKQILSMFHRRRFFLFSLLSGTEPILANNCGMMAFKHMPAIFWNRHPLFWLEHLLARPAHDITSGVRPVAKYLLHGVCRPSVPACLVGAPVLPVTVCQRRWYFSLFRSWDIAVVPFPEMKSVKILFTTAAASLSTAINPESFASWSIL